MSGDDKESLLSKAIKELEKEKMQKLILNQKLDRINEVINGLATNNYDILSLEKFGFSLKAIKEKNPAELTKVLLEMKKTFEKELQEETKVIVAQQQLIGTHYEADAAKQSATQNKQTELQIEKLKNDPTTLSPNELEILELAKRLNIFDEKFHMDPAAIRNAVNSGDINNYANLDIPKAVLKLQKDLNVEGHKVTKDGTLSVQDVFAVKAIISENLSAIKDYQELTGESLIPRNTPKVVPVAELENSK